MGGMHGLGPIMPDADEHPFDHDWEGRVLACFLAMAAWGKWNIDRGRFFRESVPGPRYLSISYFEIWLDALIGLIVDAGLADAEELVSGQAEAGGDVRTPSLTAEKVPPAMRRGGSTRRDEVDFAGRFSAGDHVRARNMNPHGATPACRATRAAITAQSTGCTVSSSCPTAMPTSPAKRRRRSTACASRRVSCGATTRPTRPTRCSSICGITTLSRAHEPT